jgi:hypothetical protein
VGAATGATTVYVSIVCPLRVMNLNVIPSAAASISIAP